MEGLTVTDSRSRLSRLGPVKEGVVEMEMGVDVIVMEVQLWRWREIWTWREI